MYFDNYLRNRHVPANQNASQTSVPSASNNSSTYNQSTQNKYSIGKGQSAYMPSQAYSQVNRTFGGNIPPTYSDYNEGQMPGNGCNISTYLSQIRKVTNGSAQNSYQTIDAQYNKANNRVESGYNPGYTNYQPHKNYANGIDNRYICISPNKGGKDGNPIIANTSVANISYPGKYTPSKDDKAFIQKQKSSFRRSESNNIVDQKNCQITGFVPHTQRSSLNYHSPTNGNKHQSNNVSISNNSSNPYQQAPETYSKGRLLKKDSPNQSISFTYRQQFGDMKNKNAGEDYQFQYQALLSARQKTSQPFISSNFSPNIDNWVSTKQKSGPLLCKQSSSKSSKRQSDQPYTYKPTTTFLTNNDETKSYLSSYNDGKKDTSTANTTSVLEDEFNQIKYPKGIDIELEKDIELLRNRNKKTELTFQKELAKNNYLAELFEKGKGKEKQHNLSEENESKGSQINEIKVLKTKIQGLQKQLIEKGTILDDKQFVITQIQKKCEEIKARQTQKTVIWQREIDAQRAKFEEYKSNTSKNQTFLSQKIASLENQMQKLQVQRQNFNAKNAELQNQIVNQTKQKSKLACEIDLSAIKIQELKVQIEKKTNLIKDLRRNIDGSNSKVEHQNKQVSNLKILHSNLIIELQNQKLKIEKLQLQIDEFKINNGILIQQIEDLNLINKNLVEEKMKNKKQLSWRQRYQEILTVFSINQIEGDFHRLLMAKIHQKINLCKQAQLNNLAKTPQIQFLQCQIIKHTSRCQQQNKQLKKLNNRMFAKDADLHHGNKLIKEANQMIIESHIFRLNEKYEVLLSSEPQW